MHFSGSGYLKTDVVHQGRLLSKCKATHLHSLLHLQHAFDEGLISRVQVPQGTGQLRHWTHTQRARSLLHRPIERSGTGTTHEGSDLKATCAGTQHAFVAGLVEGSMGPPRAQNSEQGSSDAVSLTANQRT